MGRASMGMVRPMRGSGGGRNKGVGTTRRARRGEERRGIFGFQRESDGTRQGVKFHLQSNRCAAASLAQEKISHIHHLNIHYLTSPSPPTNHPTIQPQKHLSPQAPDTSPSQAHHQPSPPLNPTPPLPKPPRRKPLYHSTQRKKKGQANQTSQAG